MFTRDRSPRVAILLAAILASGCATTNAPSGWLPNADSARREAFGGWIEIRTRSNVQPIAAEGELIAIDTDSVFVLTAAGIAGIACGDVEGAKVTGYAVPYETLGGWAVLGTISTLSHGVYLIGSAPFWIVAGTGLTAGVSRVPQVIYPQRGWKEFRIYARFPGGWPSGLDRRSVQAKPVETGVPEPKHRTW